MALLQYRASTESLQQIVFWSLGSMTRATWPANAILGAALVILVPLFWANGWRLTALRLGDARAASMGVDVGRVDWMREGELTSLVETRYEAERSGQTGELAFPTHNLLIDAGGTASLDDMVASTKRGLLLTCLWYIREVDPQTMLLTGLTRDGVYVVEDGEIVGAANNFRWNESPIDLLNRFTAASATVPSFSREWGDDYFSRTATPALRVPDFNMSSVSQGV